MNRDRQERNEDIVYAIQQHYEYETTHRDAVDNYSVLLDSRELEYRCHIMQFSNAPQEHKLHYYCVVDIAYLGQEEMEIPIDDDMLRGIVFNAEDTSYIEACADVTVNIEKYGVYAYMNYPEISVQAVIDLETDCMVTETPEFNQELFQEILYGAELHRWQVVEVAGPKTKTQGSSR